MIADSCVEGGQVFEQRMRQSHAPSAPAAQASVSAEPRPAGAGPVVERVRKQVTNIKNIPTDVDYRAEDVIEEEVVSAFAATPETGEATPEEIAATKARLAAEAAKASAGHVAAAPAAKPAADKKHAEKHADKGEKKKPTKKKE
jgi:hypothetical protein